MLGRRVVEREHAQIVYIEHVRAEERPSEMRESDNPAVCPTFLAGSAAYDVNPAVCIISIFHPEIRGSINVYMLTVAQNKQSIKTEIRRGVVNPIVEFGADPWVIRYAGYFYYCRVRGGRVEVNKAKNLEDIDREKHTVWAPGKEFMYKKQIWAPELHSIQDRWYIYFAATDSKNENHRMYVLESASDDPQSKYRFIGKIADESDKWAIDGTVFHHNNSYYFIWSGWEGENDVAQNLYIAKMRSPTTLSGERVLISKPDYKWEFPNQTIIYGDKAQYPAVNEGPEVLKRNGRVFIIYSASGSWSDEYCLGQLELIGDNPLRPEAWVKKPEPVFCKTSKIFGPGHASFVVDDQGLDWIIYHTAKFKGGGWRREVRAQTFKWHSDGTPNFGRPHR